MCNDICFSFCENLFNVSSIYLKSIWIRSYVEKCFCTLCNDSVVVITMQYSPNRVGSLCPLKGILSKWRAANPTEKNNCFSSSEFISSHNAWSWTSMCLMKITLQIEWDFYSSQTCAEFAEMQSLYSSYHKASNQPMKPKRYFQNVMHANSLMAHVS